MRETYAQPLPRDDYDRFSSHSQESVTEKIRYEQHQDKYPQGTRDDGPPDRRSERPSLDGCPYLSGIPSFFCGGYISGGIVGG
jgi:hypothetical protein